MSQPSRSSPLSEQDLNYLTQRGQAIYDARLKAKLEPAYMEQWDDEPRRPEILVLEGNPLRGVELLLGSLIEIEMTDGGAVNVGPL